MAELIIGPALALGLAIGVYEFILMSRDVQVSAHKFGHGVQAIGLSVAFTFGTMNTEFVLHLIPALQTIPVLGTVLGARIALGLLSVLRIHGASLAVKGAGSGPGLGESWFHSILIGALIVAAPYAYPVLEPAIPPWLKF